MKLIIMKLKRFKIDGKHPNCSACAISYGKETIACSEGNNIISGGLFFTSLFAITVALLLL